MINMVNGAFAASLLLLIFLAIIAWKIKPQQHGSKKESVVNQDATTSSTTRPSVQIVVLGDIGRSPRMQYHAISLAARDYSVFMIGYKDSEIHPELQSNSNVTVLALPPSPSLFQTSNKFLFLLFAPFKVVWQTFALYSTLAYKGSPPEWILVQNPPSIPVLAVASLVSNLRKSKLIIDWHNLGWSVLALKLGTQHPLVRIARKYENIFAKCADRNFAVTRAMSEYLSREVGIVAYPLHDRPANDFQPLNESQRTSFLSKLELTQPYVSEILSKQRRLIVSSTSWTQDEDFGLLLDALVDYSSKATKSNDLPYILAVITGKGPQKEYYLRRLKELDQSGFLSRVDVLTAWLPTEDYAALLGAADLGISLHKSTSGLDLPMKVVDMFGAGLPVIGYDGYESWPELVKEGVNGRGFRDSKGLEMLLVNLFENDGTALNQLKAGALKESQWRWENEWHQIAGIDVFSPK